MQRNYRGIKLAQEQLKQTIEKLEQGRLRIRKTTDSLLQKRADMIEQRKMLKQMRRARKQIRKARGDVWYKKNHLLPLLRHLLPIFIFLVSWIFPPSPLQAQTYQHVFSEEKSIDSIPVGNLRAEVDAIAFFHDNEYDSKLTKGYTLPGVRLTPHLAYNPLHQVNIELGVSMLFFNGANRYPCYAYHDIGTWKGNQYQSGSHTLPWVRLQASLKHLDVVLGNIYGGSNHGLSAPMFNAEQNLSADPEMGFQLLWHRKHIEMDTWLNWQSYIFKQDSHQEAFTVGENARILWGETENEAQWYTPIQLTIQHRGGEQDTTKLGVQTLCNASIGIGMNYKANKFKKVDYINAELAALANYQQAGHLWPFESGLAFHGSLKGSFLGHIQAEADYIHAPRQFISLFGNPYFSTISLKIPGMRLNGTNTLRTAVFYKYTFAKAYTLAAQAEAFLINAPAGRGHDAFREFNFSFGIYFRCSPSFLIKNFGEK